MREDQIHVKKKRKQKKSIKVSLKKRKKEKGEKSMRLAPDGVGDLDGQILLYPGGNSQDLSS